MKCWRGNKLNSYFHEISRNTTQWKFSSQKGMKNNLMAKAGLEPGTAEFPQIDALTTEP